jgi:hypothetical protein
MQTKIWTNCIGFPPSDRAFAWRRLNNTEMVVARLKESRGWGDHHALVILFATIARLLFGVQN